MEPTSDVKDLITQAIVDKNYETLDIYKNSLSLEEREELCAHLLHPFHNYFYASENEEALIETLLFLEELFEEYSERLIFVARFYFRIGTLFKKERAYTAAQAVIERVEKRDLVYLKEHPEVFQLYGNVLFALGKLLQESSLFELAITKLEEAMRLIHEPDFDLLWDMGKTWSALATLSGERGDVAYALQAFSQADALEQTHPVPYFLLDYGDLAVNAAHQCTDHTLLEKAIGYYKKSITQSYMLNPKKPLPSYTLGWNKLAVTQKRIFEHTGKIEDFEKADATFKEALIHAPAEAHLWMAWGELFFSAGLIFQQAKLIETALEKFTTLKSDECSPFTLTCSLSQGLALLGLYIEDLNLINEAHGKAAHLLETSLEDGALLYALGCSLYAKGCYFSDVITLFEASDMLQKAVEYTPDNKLYHYTLHRALYQLSLILRDPHLLNEALKTLDHLISLSPTHALYLSDQAESLMQLYFLEECDDKKADVIEKAITLYRKSVTLQGEEGDLYEFSRALDEYGDFTGEEIHYIEGIELLSSLLEKYPQDLKIASQLAKMWAHLGELKGDISDLYRAVDIYRDFFDQNSDDDEMLCQFGYLLLNLSELIYDPFHPEESELLKNEVEVHLIRAISLGNSDANYHLACLYSLTEFNELSMHYLRRAAESQALPPIEDLEHDEWLFHISQTEDFKEFIASKKRGLSHGE